MTVRPLSVPGCSEQDALTPSPVRTGSGSTDPVYADPEAVAVLSGHVLRFMNDLATRLGALDATLPECGQD